MQNMKTILLRRLTFLSQLKLEQDSFLFISIALVEELYSGEIAKRKSELHEVHKCTTIANHHLYR